MVLGIMRNSCMEISLYGEKTYRLLMDIIKHEIDRLGIGDINSVQAYLLMNIDENVLTISEVISRGYYIGTNPSYSIKRLVNSGYIVQIPSEYDKRSVYLKLTDKGLELCDKLSKVIDKYSKSFEAKSKGEFDITNGLEFLKNIERHLSEVLIQRS